MKGDTVMLLLICIIYIVVFSCRLCMKFSPVLAAMADEDAAVPQVRVSLTFCAGIILYAASWAYVFSEILEGLYV